MTNRDAIYGALHNRVALRLAAITVLTVALAGVLPLGLTDSASADRKPALPAMTFPAGTGVQRTGSPELLASDDTVLGQSQLVAFWSTSGLCVEFDHLEPSTRAGGCGFGSLSAKTPIMPVAAGYSGDPGVGSTSGVTEILGQAVPSTQSVLIEYRRANIISRVRATVGRVPRQLRKSDGPSSASWFGANLRGCVGGRSVTIRAFDPKGILLGEANGLPQDAACKAGGGYKVRGSVVFGSLP